MRLYAGTSEQFCTDTARNQIAEKLRNAYLAYYRSRPAPSEVTSWQNSLRALKDVIKGAELNDHGVLLEYQLPLTSRRLDCMLCGTDRFRDDKAVIIELKQWQGCEASPSDNELITLLGGARREVLHPAVQVRQYEMYLRDTHTAFYEPPSPIGLSSCCYLHNYRFEANDPMLASKFSEVLSSHPVFSADDFDGIASLLGTQLSGGDGLPVLARVEQSKYRPSKQLMQHVANVIKGNPEYVLLDEQLVAFDRVLGMAKGGFGDGPKTTIMITGGPGTGKSVIALNLVAELLRMNHNAQYATGSKAFTETLRKIIGARGSVQFKYFNSYTKAEANAVDVLVCDEAHRIRETSNSRFTRASLRSRRPQIEELIESAKVSVFLLDDKQVVRPNEIGSVGYIRDAALRFGCSLHEYELDLQFRCGGSEAFVNWVNNTLDIVRTENILFQREDQESFEFRIIDSAEELERAIAEKRAKGYGARLTAGFCWPWSQPRRDGTLIDDIVIGDYRRPWNAKPESHSLAADVPRASYWATDPRGVGQVGCVYTAQGFEFDYVGVIFGSDLRYDPDQAKWIGDRAKSFDVVVKRAKGSFTNLVKNTYRVLLTRGLRGCFVYFVDKETERFIRSRIE